jgi:hypothetical protein
MFGYDRMMGRFGGQRWRGRGYGGDFREGGSPGFPRGGSGGRSGYGEAGHPGFGGYPGSRREGMIYGGGRGGRPGWAQSEVERWDPPRHGYDRSMTGRYDEPFLPEWAYRRHPELDRPRTRSAGSWPDRGHVLEQPDGGYGDADIARGVREGLYQDTWLQADDIQVEVRDGVVTLKGEVDDYMEARYAWDDAWEAAGVRGVVNQLTVRTDRADRAPHGDVLPQTGGSPEPDASA